MDSSFLGFLATIVAIGVAITVPLVLLMYVRAKTRPKSIAENVEGIEALRARVAELDNVQRRLSEVEERLDFTERLLVRADKRDQSPIRRDALGP